MSAREEFIEIYQAQITRPGADALLEYLEHKSDFFTAPSSTRFHGCYEGGLCEHSVNVYQCLKAYLERERVRELYGLEYTPESVALVTCARAAATARAPAMSRAPTASGPRCPPISSTTPCPTATGRRASISSTATCA